MDFIIVVLTVSSCFIEYEIIRHVTWLRKSLQRYVLFSLGFSLVLSAMLGMFFGAAGVLVFVAGIASTVIMQPVYWAYRSGNIDRIYVFGHDIKAAWNRNWNSIVAFCQAIKAIIILIYRIVAFFLGCIVFIFRMLGIVASALSGLKEA